MKLYAVSLLLLLLDPTLFAQAVTGNPQRTTASTAPIALAMVLEKQVQEVNLILSVTDRKGHFVRGLLPSDLTILDNNKQQTAITFFQSQTDLPLHIALLLDISSSVAYRFSAEQETMQAFLREVAKPRDSVELIAFNQGVQFVAPISGNWKQVSRRVKRLKPGGETALYDAVKAASQRLAEDPRPARRIIILVSDGEENHSQATSDSTVAEVLKDEAVLYAVNVGDDHFSDSGKRGDQVLQQLSDATGGTYLQAGPNGAVNTAFGKIRCELRSQYALAYKPSNLGQFFHQLKVIAGNLRVRCRTGYYVKEAKVRQATVSGVEALNR
ncbi:MAG TPA: VWA domain-containing protein [Terriglobales bacterium]|nr:VWA domain-containing protein [Terriglobales bacterium]